MNTKKLTLMGMFTALSIAAVWLVHFPIFPAVAFLEYDPADVPILIAGCLFGPIPGLVLTAAASIIQGLTVSAQSGVYGVIMHFIATGVFVTAVSLIFRTGKSKTILVIGLIAGMLAMTVVMTISNILITPYFMGIERAELYPLLPLIALFNLVKAGINSVITFVVHVLLEKQLMKLKKG